MVTGDRDRIELGHILRGVLEDVGNDPHREFGRIDISVAHHELFEDVVLDRSGHLFELCSLLQSGIDVESQDGQNSSVHRHGNGHLAQWNTVEKDFHIFQRANGNTGLADIAHHARMIRVITAVRGQIECHGQTLLTGGQIATIESVRLFRRRESGILANSPRTHGIHAAIGASQERRQTGYIVEMLHAFKVVLRIEGLYHDLLRSTPVSHDALFFRPARSILSHEAGGLNIDVFIIRFHL